jgi:hypothetical protein
MNGIVVNVAYAKPVNAAIIFTTYMFLHITMENIAIVNENIPKK